MKKLTRRLWLLALAFMLAAALAACRSDGPLRAERIIVPERRIPLQEGGPHAGQANAGRATVAYQYVRHPSDESAVNLTVAGKILQVQRKSIQVNIYLLALDQGGRVVSRDVLFASGFKRSSNIRISWTFDKTLDLPPETTGIAFDAYTRASRGRR